MTVYTAPNGQGFKTYVGKSCICGPPCWQARCKCGEKLTAHDFTEESARACAIEALTKPGHFQHHCRGAVA